MNIWRNSGMFFLLINNIMSNNNSNSNSNKCPDCNCPPQITMDDIIKAMLYDKSNLMVSATDRWEKEVHDTSGILPNNPNAQNTMPYSPLKEDIKTILDMTSGIDVLTKVEEIDYRINEKLLNQLKYPELIIKEYQNRGMNNSNNS